MRNIESRCRRSLRTLFQACGLALVAAASAGAASPPDPALWPRVLIKDQLTEEALRWALHDAAGLLSAPKCQAVLTEFKDQDGQPLQEKLDALGFTAGGYLPLILFRDGAGEGKCRTDFVFAYTAPGSRVVYVCGRRFQELWRREPWMAKVIVIHEALHTLGLGENPPSSGEITRRVRHRCVS